MSFVVRYAGRNSGKGVLVTDDEEDALAFAGRLRDRGVTVEEDRLVPDANADRPGDSGAVGDLAEGEGDGEPGAPEGEEFHRG